MIGVYNFNQMASSNEPLRKLTFDKLYVYENGENVFTYNFKLMKGVNHENNKSFDILNKDVFFQL